MGGAGKRLLMFMESAQQQLGGGVWLRCATICAFSAIPVENSAVVATTRKELTPFMRCRGSSIKKEVISPDQLQITAFGDFPPLFLRVKLLFLRE